MCGRYWIEQDDPQLMEIIAEMQRLDVQAKAEGEIFPGDKVPVLCKSRAGRVRPFAMEWGYKLDGGKRIINARSETAAEKPMFREGMAMRRCLLPMSAYFEWEKAGNGKKKHRISPEVNGLFCLAGIYRFENDRPKCTVLTMDAAEEIRFIHPRMPVLIPWEQTEKYLGGEDPAWQMKMKFEPEYTPLPLLDF